MEHATSPAFRTDLGQRELPSLYVADRRPPSLFVAVAGLLTLAALALPAGVSFLFDPSGASLGIPPGYRELLPVADFAPVGAFLVVVLGAGPLVVVYGLLTRREGPLTRALDRRLGHHWAWTGALAVCGALIALILAEVVLFASRPAPVMTALWALCLALAGAILASALRPPVWLYFAEA